MEEKAKWEILKSAETGMLILYRHENGPSAQVAAVMEPKHTRLIEGYRDILNQLDASFVANVYKNIAPRLQGIAAGTVGTSEHSTAHVAEEKTLMTCRFRSQQCAQK